MRGSAADRLGVKASLLCFKYMTNLLKMTIKSTGKSSCYQSPLMAVLEAADPDAYFYADKHLILHSPMFCFLNYDGRKRLW